jgi:hypothetical protein
MMVLLAAMLGEGSGAGWVMTSLLKESLLTPRHNQHDKFEHRLHAAMLNCDKI